MSREIIILDDIALVPYLHGTEYKMIRRDQTADQVFSFIEAKTNIQRHYDVTRLMEIALAGTEPEVVRSEMLFLASHIQQILDYNGIEQPRLDRLTPKDLATPGIIIKLKDDTEIIADGNHRIVRHYREGRDVMNFYIIQEEVAKVALLDLPEEQGEALAKAGERSKAHG